MAALQLKHIDNVLAQGGVIACATEAVWGLSCDPDNPSAVERLLALKNRPINKGLILVASDIEQFGDLLEGLNDGQLARLTLSWPGPTS